MKHRPKSQTNSTTDGCYTTLLLAVAPISIYFLQLLGKVSTVAAALAGVLIILKALVEWQTAMRRLACQQKAVPTSQKPEKLVRVLPQSIAGCYLCQKQRPLLEYCFEDMQVGLCQDCHRCISITRARI